jgi:hypothetical protein
VNVEVRPPEQSAPVTVPGTANIGPRTPVYRGSY